MINGEKIKKAPGNAGGLYAAKGNVPSPEPHSGLVCCYASRLVNVTVNK